MTYPATQRLPKSRSAPYPLLRKIQPEPEIKSPTASQITWFLILHAPIMLILQLSSLIAGVYALLIFFTGLYYLAKDKSPIRTTWVLGYLAGAEILWRGSDAPLIFEFGKYATLLLSLLLILKYKGRKSMAIWPVLFISLLLPGIFVAPRFDREAVSFQLAGPVTLAIASLAFSFIKFKKTDLQHLLLSVIAPNVAMACFIAFLGLTANVNFSAGGANEEITGGIGANQVTSALSLGATAAFFYVFLSPRRSFIRNLMIFLFIFMAVTSILTFSRAGLWNTLGAVIMSIPFLFRSRWQGSSTFGFLLILGVLGSFIIYPFLNSLTGGAFSARFSDLDSTGRDILVKIDYEVFQENPILGVGVGQSVYYHLPYFGYLKPTHTEYSRLLAEHGLLGVLAILILSGVILSRLLSSAPPFSKAIAISFAVWALLYMTHSATRMVAPSFAFGLAAAIFLIDEDESPAPEPMRHRIRR